MRIICLLGLHRTLDHDFAVDLCRRILFISHRILGNKGLGLFLLNDFRLCRLLLRRRFRRGCFRRRSGRRSVIAVAAAA